MRVLIVDDHPIVASGCRALFAGNDDVEILEACDAEGGERLFVAERPDVCVLDINLPTVSGFELARRILARTDAARDDAAFVAFFRSRPEILSGIANPELPHFAAASPRSSDRQPHPTPDLSGARLRNREKSCWFLLSPTQPLPPALKTAGRQAWLPQCPSVALSNATRRRQTRNSIWKRR